MKIYTKKVDGLTLPERGSQVAAGYDIVATSDPKIVGEKLDEGNWIRVDYVEYETNIFIAPSAVTFHTLIHPRSSISKYSLVLANSIGLVDNDYRGMVICRFKYIWQPEDYRFTNFLGNLTSFGGGIVNTEKIYKRGDKIAQLVFEPTVQVEFEVVDDLSVTQRGAGGFGSSDQPTGKLVTVPSRIDGGRVYPKISDDGDVIKIRAIPTAIVEQQPTEPPKRKYDVGTEYHKTGKSSIIERWQKMSDSPDSPKPVGYEKLVKEREKGT